MENENVKNIKITISETDFKHAYKRAKIAIKKSDSRKMLIGSCFHIAKDSPFIRVISTNGQILTFTEIPIIDFQGENQDYEFIVSYESLVNMNKKMNRKSTDRVIVLHCELRKDYEKNLNKALSWWKQKTNYKRQYFYGDITFEFTEGQTYKYSIVQGNYPCWEAVTPQNNEIFIAFERKPFIEAIVKATLEKKWIDNVQSPDYQNQPVIITFESNKAHVVCGCSNIPSKMETVSYVPYAESKGYSESFSMIINGSFLTNILKNTNSKFITLAYYDKVYYQKYVTSVVSIYEGINMTNPNPFYDSNNEMSLLMPIKKSELD